MTYRCGTNGLQALGIPNGEPRYICDKCGAVQSFYRPNGMPYAWILDGKLPPGWRKIEGKDFCKKCMVKE